MKATKNQVFFYGLNQVVGVIRSQKRKIIEIIATKEGIGKLSSKGIKLSNLSVHEVSIKHINTAMNLSSVNHQGVVCVASSKGDIDTLEAIKKSNFVVVMNEITDVGNAGAIIRSSVGLGVDLILANKFGMPDILNNPDICKSSAGVSENANISQVASLSKWIDCLKQNNFKVIGLDVKGAIDVEVLSQKFLQDGVSKIALLVGSEGFGIDKKFLLQCTDVVKIDISNLVESLNASAAVAIAIFEIRKVLTKKIKKLQ